MLPTRSVMQEEPKEGKSTLQEKWELEELLRVSRNQGQSCAAPQSLLCVCVRYMVGHSTVTSNQSLVKKSCDLLPTARCQGLQGPRPLLCIRLKSGSAGWVLPAPPFPADWEHSTRQQRMFRLAHGVTRARVGKCCELSQGKQGKA